MADQTYYDSGSITVDAGAALATFEGTTMLSNARAGDQIFVVGSKSSVFVKEVVDNLTLNIAPPWPDTDVSDHDYYLVRGSGWSDTTVFSVDLAKLFARLNSGLPFTPHGVGLLSSRPTAPAIPIGDTSYRYFTAYEDIPLMYFYTPGTGWSDGIDFKGQDGADGDITPELDEAIAEVQALLDEALAAQEAVTAAVEGAEDARDGAEDALTATLAAKTEVEGLVDDAQGLLDDTEDAAIAGAASAAAANTSKLDAASSATLSGNKATESANSASASNTSKIASEEARDLTIAYRNTTEGYKNDTNALKGDVQAMKDSVEATKNDVTTLAGQVATNKGLVDTAKAATETARDATIAARDVATGARDSALSSEIVATAKADLASSLLDQTEDAAQLAINFLGLHYLMSSQTAMSAPTAGRVRLNNALRASTTQIAVAGTTADTGNPSVMGALATLGYSNSPIKGRMMLKQAGAPEKFLIYDVTGLTDNTTWVLLDVTYREAAGTILPDADMIMQFFATGNLGAAGDGSGDMLGDDYDTNGDFIVNAADVAYEVAYANVTDRPMDSIVAAIALG